MKKEQTKLEVGDQIKFVGPLCVNGNQIMWAHSEMEARVEAEMRNSHDGKESKESILTVSINDGYQKAFIHPRQVTRVRKRATPASKRVKLRPYEVIATRLAMAGQRHGLGVGDKTAHFLKSGEAIVSREKLAKAWRDALGFSDTEDFKDPEVSSFPDFCKILGIPEEK